MIYSVPPTLSVSHYHPLLSVFIVADVHQRTVQVRTRSAAPSTSVDTTLKCTQSILLGPWGLRGGVGGIGHSTLWKMHILSVMEKQNRF
jgi:hypothetical protein